MPPRRGWDDLAPRSRDRWVSRFGGRGTREQRERRARAAYETEATISRALAGHEPVEIREGRTISGFVGPGAEPHLFEGLSRRDVQRVGRYNRAVEALAQHRAFEGRPMTPDRFRMMVARSQPVGGERFAGDPDAVLARLEELRAAGEEVFHYESGRAA